MNYEVKAVIKTVDEQAKQIKKTEVYLILNSETCADAEYQLLRYLYDVAYMEVAIVSTKESNLIPLFDSESTIDSKYYKVTTQEAVSGEGDKLKYVKTSYLKPSKSVYDATSSPAFNNQEIIAISLSRIVDVLEAQKFKS